MVMGVRNIGMTLAIAILSMIAGCQKHGGSPICKSDMDCRVDATGKEIGGVCYMGKCEECAVDTDCSDLKQCVKNRCMAACQADGDCGSHERCENDYCVGGLAEGAEANKNAWAEGECKELEKVYFDFDRFDIKAE